MLETRSQARERFVIMPSPHKTQEFYIYDCLLEQMIGAPHTSLQNSMEMAIHLNRISPHDMYS